MTKCDRPPKTIYWLGGAKKHEDNFKKSTDYKEWIESGKLVIIPERISKFSEENNSKTVITNQN